MAASKTAPKRSKLSEEKHLRINEEASDSSSDDAELDEFDELDIEESEVSGSEDEVEDEENDEENDEDNQEESEDSETDAAPKKDDFDTALNAIIGSKVKAHDQANPILIRNKRSAKEIDEARENVRARKAIRAERLSMKDKARVRNVIPKDPEEAGDVLANEKRLRKIAQRGVVKLMNAINSAQNAALAELAGDAKPQANADLSKEKFLDMLRMG